MLENLITFYCSDPFWDLNKTWNSEIPDFTSCFQDTIFVFIPSLLFSVFFIFNLCILKSPSSQNYLPWTWLNTTKVVLSVFLLLLSILCSCSIFYKSISDADASIPCSSLLATSSKVILFISLIAITLRHKTCGLSTSYLLAVFWLVFTLCAAVLHRSVLVKYFTLGLKPKSEFIFYLDMMYYPLIYLQMILSIFTDKKNFQVFQNSNIIDDVSFLSFVCYLWFNKFIYMSTRKFLSVCDLAFVSFRLTTKYVFASFIKHWNFYESTEILKHRSLLWSLIKSFWPWFLTALLCDLSFIIALLLPPLLLDCIIDFVYHDSYPWRGYFFAVIIFVVDFVGKIVQNNAIFLFFNVGAQMKSALMNAIYRKNLILSTASRKGLTSGNISSLISIDVERIYYFTWNFSLVIVSPIKIFLIIVIMWQYIGPSTLAGVGVIFLLFPISFYISRISGSYYEKHMKVKDTRLKFMTEVLSGIKILKLYAWEIPFSAKVSQARKEELQLVLYNQICYVLTTFVFFCAPIMVSIASFTTFLLVDSNNVLDPTRAFVSLTLMEQLRYAMFELPDAVSELIQCNIALGRLKEYFVSENIDFTVVGSSPDQNEVLSIKQASFSWTVDNMTLNNISLHVPKGRLVAVIGPVGCGKSSLLSATLGQMYKMCGSVDLKGSIAYVPQQAWIQNATLMDNILLMKCMDETRYRKILDLCCLGPDLEILPAGDKTEIGEKGVNLSGGQKQRVSLARAVYQDKDVYLLDDTLSAVDVHVQKALFDNVIGNHGILKQKTRILVTHDVSILSKVDLIVCMKDGNIVEIGTYKELLSGDGSFTNFIQEHTSEKHLEENIRSLDRLISTDSTSSKLSEISGNQEISLKKKDLDDDEMYRLIDEEKMETGSVSKLVYWNYIKAAGILLTVFAFFGYMFYVAFETAGNVWLGKMSSNPIVNGTQDSSLIIQQLEVYGALGFLQAICVLVGSSAMIYGTIVAARKYHNNMLDNIMKSPMSFFDSTPMGRIMNRFTSDLDILDMELADRVDGWINCFFFSIASFYIVGSKAPIFLVSLLPLVIIFYVMQRLHLTAIWQIRRLESITKSPIFSQLLESIQGVSSINAFKVQDDFIESFEEKLEKHMVCQFGIIACDRWLNFYLDIVGSSIVLVATLLAVYYRHTLSAADVGLMITYALTVTNALKWFVRMNTELENKSISVERCQEYCNLKSEGSWTLAQENVPSDWPSEGSILFENYSTKYRENLDLVLRDINLSINGGEKVGIVGRTGAGKSSITMALFRIIESVSGTIFIDEVNIASIGLHTLRSKLTIIPQDPVLFTGSLRLNLDPNSEYEDDELWKSLERSHLKEFVTNLEEGLEHKIEEGGENLSSGQKQLVCLARALLKNTKILVLDEATASVDMETDNLIQNTIRTAFARHTVITIAHRINTIVDYDKIIVMENGTVIEVGNPTALMKTSESKFYAMAQEAGLI